MKMNHEKEMDKIQTKLKATKFFLLKSTNEVVKPLMQEIKLIQEINQRYKSQYDKNFQDLIIMHAILRLPRMSDTFYKTMKRKEQAEVFETRK